VDKKQAEEARRAAAILNGKIPADPPLNVSASHAGGPFVILIGTFSNASNVRQVQKKIGDLGMRVDTEPLESPDGVKTRVRAGSFPNLEAAEKALAKIRNIGLDGKITTKQ
jgi:DedD protein